MANAAGQLRNRPSAAPMGWTALTCAA